MTSSGMKRGLATIAVSALAVTGLPALAGTASAVTINDQVGGATVVSLLSQYNTGNEASVKNDGQNTTVRLEAAGGAGITSMKFQYSLNGTDFFDIATVATRNDDGAFSYEWAATGLAGATVTLRAQGTTTTGAVVNDDQALVEVLGGGASAESVNLNDGSALGVFQQPYGTTDDQLVIVSGTSSANTGVVNVSRRNGAGALAGTAKDFVVTDADGAGAGTTGVFKDSLDITGYAYSGDGSADQIIIGAERDTDDVEAYTLYKQAITTVTATADRTNVPAGETATVTVTVKDQSGNPIAGAQVFSSDSAEGEDPKYTDANGQVKFTQTPGSFYYYANATNSAAYEPELGDKKSDNIAVGQYNPAPTTLAATSADGAAFDDDEYALGDITVQIKDQQGNDYEEAGRTVSYYWVLTPFDGDPATKRIPTTGTDTAPTDADGNAIIVFPVAEESGTYELYAGLNANALGNQPIASSKVLTVKAGEATIKYDEASPEQAPAGTSEVVDGKLVLEDGTGLPARKIDLDFDRGTESGTGADAADAGLVDSTGAITLGPIQVTTSATGGFSATVKDPVQTPQPDEKGGNVDAVPVGNADATKNDQGVDFLKSVTPATVVISSSTDVDTPGEVQTYTATVKSADDPATEADESVLLTNQDVVLSIDHGFFTDGTADPAAAAGNDAGEWKSLGQTITVKTDGSGVATFKVAIERDAGFDDDGLVTAIIAAKAGSATDTETQDWDSSDPLNGGDVDIKLSLASMQQSGVLPKAPVDDLVYLDVFVKDQFGNLVGDETVNISEDGRDAWIDTDGPGDTVVSDFDFDRDVTAYADAEGDQRVTASWTTDTYRYNAAKTAVSTPNGETLTDTSIVEWYEVDYTRSSFSLTHSGDGSEPVGGTVVETYNATDQFGEEISDLYVSFFRSGPDNLQDGDGNYNGFLGQDGMIEYVYQGAKAGTATVTAVGRDGSSTGSIVPSANRTDSVTFGAVAKQEIAATLALSNQKDGDDRAKVNAPSSAAGATVKLFKIKKDGSRVLLASKTANKYGNAKFIVNDKNGNKVTTYKAKVGATAKTFKDWTPKKSIR